mgnify:FL=1
MELACLGRQELRRQSGNMAKELGMLFEEGIVFVDNVTSEGFLDSKTENFKRNMGDMALLYVKRIFRRVPLRLEPQGYRRQIGNDAKKIGLSTEEAVQFVEVILSEVFKDFLEGTKKETKK